MTASNQHSVQDDEAMRLATKWAQEHSPANPLTEHKRENIELLARAYLGLLEQFDALVGPLQQIAKLHDVDCDLAPNIARRTLERVGVPHPASEGSGESRVASRPQPGSSLPSEDVPDPASSSVTEAAEGADNWVTTT